MSSDIRQSSSEADPRAAWTAWTAHRDAAVFSSYGVAALALTQWLDETPRPAEPAPGRWLTDGHSAISDDLALAISPGSQIEYEGLVLRGMVRDGVIALRVLSPHAAQARGVSRIERFDYDPSMSVVGQFVASEPEKTEAFSVDGHRSETEYAGRIAMTLPEGDVDLTVERSDDGSLFAVFADATAGNESYRFRFLQLDAPAEDGTVTVDFNRAYLPPCAFSDHYVCPLPPVGNRWSVPVRAGERVPA